MEKRLYNFSAGPSMLPLEVLERAQRELVCYPSCGMSVMEMSHRSKMFENILEQAKQYDPKICIGGYHLSIPATKKTVPEDILAGIAGELAGYDMDFYTCHCTGEEAFKYLAERVKRMYYFACGDTLTV